MLSVGFHFDNMRLCMIASLQYIKNENNGEIAEHKQVKSITASKICEF